MMQKMQGISFFAYRIFLSGIKIIVYKIIDFPMLNY